jgi:hypothetical protein
MLEMVISMKLGFSWPWHADHQQRCGSPRIIDKKEIGHVGVTPYAGMVKPGKHTIWLVHEEYREGKTEILVKPEDPTSASFRLERQPVGAITCWAATCRTPG